MPRLTVKTRRGAERTVEGRTGISLMEVMRDNGFDEILAICGGCCSCATCHIYVAPECSSKLSPMKREEDDLLEGISHRQTQSRLSCQVLFTTELDGLHVAIAPEE